MKINKIIITILILSIVTLVFSGCGGGNPVIPPYDDGDEQLETIIPETTKVVEEETIQQIISVSGDQSTIVFKSSTPQLEKLAPGDIIAMGVTENTPKGLLRKVKNITKGAKDSSEVIVETEFATLEEAIEQGSFYFNETLKAEDAKEPVYYVKGVEFIRDKSTMKDSKIQILDFNYKIDTIIYDGDNNPKTEEDNITLTGQVSFDYDLLLTGKIEFPHKLTKLDFQNICKIETSLKAKVGGSAKVFKREKILWTQPLGEKLVMIGSIPFILSPKISIKATAEGEIFASLTAEVYDTHIFTAGVQYNNGSWQPISSHEYIPTTASLSVSAGGMVTFGIGPILECEVDFVAGPYCGVSLGPKAIADIYENPWWTLYGRIEIEAGVKIEIFSKTIASANMKIFPNLQIIILQADGPFYGSNHPPVISSLTANPSSVNINETTAITCIASDEDVGDTLTYTWSKNVGSFEGSTSGPSVTWRAPSTADIYTVVGCEVSDGEGGEDSESINIIVTEPDDNHAPVITSTAVTSATKGQPYSYDVNATDSDGNTLTYSLTTKPSGMAINSSTGLITWTPTAIGPFGVTVKVSDGGLFDTQSFTITVSESTTPVAPYVTASDGTHNNKVALSCNTVTGATHYQFYRAASSGGTKTTLSSWQTGVTYDDFDASPAVTNYYFVRAATSSSGDNTSPYSTYDTGWKALIPPQNVSATDGLYTDQVRITWDSVPGASYYRVYRATSSGGTKTALGSWQTGTTYYDTTVTPDTTYYYFVTAAINSSGDRESIHSTSNTGYASNTLGSITVTTKDSSGNLISGSGLEYVLYKEDSGGTWQYIKTVAAPSNTYKFSDLSAGVYNIEAYTSGTYRGTAVDISLSSGQNKSVTIIAN